MNTGEIWTVRKCTIIIMHTATGQFRELHEMSKSTSRKRKSRPSPGRKELVAVAREGSQATLSPWDWKS